MVNKVFKVGVIFLITIMVISIVMPVWAKYIDPQALLDEVENADPEVPQKFQSIAGTVIAVVQVIGLTVAIVMLIVLAIKYLYSSPNDRAEIKKHMIVYVVGAVLLFGVSAILELIKSFATNL